MKYLLRKIVKIALLYSVIFSVIPGQRILAQSGYDVSYDDFYNDLAPYGQWIDDPQYGYIWSPDVEPGFRPYFTDGHWIMTEYGNTWVSDYPWGWAAFHYGRWTFDPYYGWIWIPGTVWGPAWVAWRYGDGYYGWAPLGPGIEIGIGFGNYYCPDDWWVFIPPRYIYHPRYYKYWHGPRDNAGYIHRTHILNNTYTNPHNNRVYVTGPRPEEVQRITNKPVKTYSLQQSNTPGTARISDNTVSLFHPMTVTQNNRYGNKPVPPNNIRATQPVGQPHAVGDYGDKKPQFRTGGTPTPNVAPQPNRNPVQYQPPVQYHQQQQPEVQPIHHYQPPAPPVQQQPVVQPQRNNNQRGYTPQPPVRNYNPPVQQHYNPPPPQPPVQHYNPPVQQRGYTPPPPPVQHYNPPPVQHNPPPVQQPNNNGRINRR